MRDIPSRDNSIFLKVELQIIAAWKNDRELHLYLVGKCTPDYGLMSRSRYIRQTMSGQIPAAWLN